MTHRFAILALFVLLGGCCRGKSSDQPVPVVAPPAAAPAATESQPPAPAPAPAPAPQAGAAKEAPAPEGSGVYKAEELKGRIADLNDLCGDTWCEGEYDYTFTGLTCEKKNKCVLSFTAKHADSGKSYQTKVDVSGFTSVVPDDDGGFDEAVGEALGKWEKSSKK